MYPNWTFVDCAGLAATLPVSYDSLVRRAQLKPGETVLVHSAAGGLGIMAVQIAIAIGCTVIGTAGSADKCSYVQSFGPRLCLDYTQTGWHEQVLEATQGRGVDVVFDPVGLIGTSLKCTAHRGRLLVIGFAGREGEMEKVAMNHVLLKQVQLIGYVSSQPFLLTMDSMPTNTDSSDMGRPCVEIRKKESLYGLSLSVCSWLARSSLPLDTYTRG